ncbi:Rad1-domain-containing protein [Rhodofomes roseus]|uniref:Rad1-domain-containing protein n=1 Tax=Rhodofomes roseus TaxID=34475 RepID=A0ABQ8KWU4_9APHY|nr:Rad1-domain-containing protein [Rhodofomes roseus]KAH9843009.1 Rad1-domain-containing protein [Rhodofomes roseus]
MSDDGEVDKVLTASVHDVKYVMGLLRGVQFENRATIRATSGGLSVTVEEARTLLATAFIFKGIFDEYSYHPEAEPSSQAQSSQPASQPQEEGEPTAFEVPLNTLIECLSIFGNAGSSSSNTKHRLWHTGNSDQEDNQEEGSSNRANSRQNKGPANGRIDQYFGGDKGTGMRLSYVGAGHPLTLFMAEDASGPTATCEITTFEAEPMLELDFLESPTVLKIILKSSWLRDALSELDPTCERLTIIGNPPPPGRVARVSGPPRLRLQAVGTFGSTEMDYPSDKEVLETCDCEQQVRFSYVFKHIACASRALQNSTKTSLRINEEGMLSLQLIMPTARPRHGGNNTDGFIEFRCLPLDDDS